MKPTVHRDQRAAAWSTSRYGTATHRGKPRPGRIRRNAARISRFGGGTRGTNAGDRGEAVKNSRATAGMAEPPPSHHRSRYVDYPRRPASGPRWLSDAPPGDLRRRSSSNEELISTTNLARLRAVRRRRRAGGGRRGWRRSARTAAGLQLQHPRTGGRRGHPQVQHDLSRLTGSSCRRHGVARAPRRKGQAVVAAMVPKSHLVRVPDDLSDRSVVKSLGQLGFPPAYRGGAHPVAGPGIVGTAATCFTTSCTSSSSAGCSSGSVAAPSGTPPDAEPASLHHRPGGRVRRPGCASDLRSPLRG